MNVPAILSVVASMIGVGTAVLGWRISTAPNWAHKRLFAFVALCAAGYSTCDVVSFLDLTPAHFLLAMRVQGAFATIHGACWVLYTFAHLGVRRPRTLTVILASWGLLGAAWLVPGCMITDGITRFDVAWLGASYKVQITTSFGMVTYALDGLVLLVPIWLYVRARRRVAGAELHAGGVAVIFLCSVYDGIASELPLHVPFILPLGFLVSLAMVGVSFTNAFVDSARELDVLTKRLEHLVGERTRKLLEAESALVRAEKLVAIGKLSAGVAHEINNPSTAIAANLEYLRANLRRGSLPADAAECLDDSFDAIQRIAKIVRQLLDSTRAVASPKAGSASVERAIDQALATVRSQLNGRVIVEVDAQKGLYARGDESSLVQVLVNLLVNGAQAIPDSQEHALVRLSARERDGRVTLEVHDNGTGIPAHVRSRLFEPFFTTKPLGKGTGLGLCVSLGLVRSMGGEIEVDSCPGSTTVRVHVPTVSHAG